MQATPNPCHAAAIGPRRLSLPCHYFCPPPLWKLHECKNSWKRISGTIVIGEARSLTARANAKTKSEWGTGPYEFFENGQKYYLDEQDVVSFLDPPKELIPLDPSSYNPASYLWKKIEDIPEERRHNLLSLLDSRLISRAWEVAGGRYGDPNLAKKTSSSLLIGGGHAGLLEMWKCRTSGAPLLISWIHNSRKVKSLFWLFVEQALDLLKFLGFDDILRGFFPLAFLFPDGNPLSGIINSCSPLYFSVTQVNEVMSTEQPCDFAYEFGDGFLNIPEYPQEFPKPAKHPWPFNDHVVIYVRHVGPGVLVGQAWQEGKALQQVPKKLCGEMLMVKDYFDIGHKN